MTLKNKSVVLDVFPLNIPFQFINQAQLVLQLTSSGVSIWSANECPTRSNQQSVFFSSAVEQ
jgi:hypothetical protein